MFNKGNQIPNFMSSSGSGTVINYGSGSDFLTSSGSGSTSQKVTVPTVPVPVPQHWKIEISPRRKAYKWLFLEGQKTDRDLSLHTYTVPGTYRNGFQYVFLRTALCVECTLIRINKRHDLPPSSKCIKTINFCPQVKYLISRNLLLNPVRFIWFLTYDKVNNERFSNPS